MTVQRLARILGYAGLIPFIVFSFGTWVSIPLVKAPHVVLSAYAAVILSFMGAVHWGVAMSSDNRTAKFELGLSVLPALLGWLALLVPVLFGYSLLTLGFALLYMADKYASGKGLLPRWYLPMRFELTAVVVMCLIAAVLAVT